MKIKFSTAITNQKNDNLLHKVRKFFIEKTKPLADDSFEKNVEKQAEKKVIISRKHPNWCDMPEDGYKNNTVAKRICYYPDDVKKMESMTEDEKYLYKKHLRKMGNYYESENQGNLDELEEYLSKFNINLKDVLVKD